MSLGGGVVAGGDDEDKFKDMIMSDSLLASHGRLPLTFALDALMIAMIHCSQDTLDEFNHLVREYQECLTRLGLGDGSKLCSTAHVGECIALAPLCNQIHVCRSWDVRPCR